MANRIRLGIIGANTQRGWAKLAHFPGLPYLSEYELTAVCTSKPKSADIAAKHFGARLAFHDYRKLVSSSDIDAVVVSVNVPSHYKITMAALEARKHVLTEWPLGANLAETEELATKAALAGVVTMVGLQGRAGPANLYLRDLIQEGYIGKPLSSVIYRITETQYWEEWNSWYLDGSKGGNVLTIAAGHTLDTLAFILGEFKEFSAYSKVQEKWIRLADSGREVEATSPDHIMIQGVLQNNSLASVFVGSAPGFVTGGRLEIYGTEGTLIATSPESLHRGVVTVKHARIGENLKKLEIPQRFRWVPDEVPEGAPLNVAQLYRQFSRAISTGERISPNFDDAAKRYKLLEAVVKVSKTGERITFSN